MKLYPTELWDRMHYVFCNFTDRMVHSCLKYDTPVDVEVLKDAMDDLYQAYPLVHSQFVVNPIKPFWKECSYDRNELVEVHQVSGDVDAEAEAFLTQEIPLMNKRQFKCAVVTNGTEWVVCFVGNHMCMDGNSLSHAVTTVISHYNDRLNGKTPTAKFRRGTRSYDAIYNDMKPEDVKAAKKLFSNASPSDKHVITLTPDREGDKTFFVKKTVPAEEFAAIRAAAKAQNATVNDFMAAAYIRALYQTEQFDPEQPFIVSSAIDLRGRYVKDQNSHGYTNHSTFMPISVPRMGKDMHETLDYVHQCSTELKNDPYLGLYSLPLLNIAFNYLPHFIGNTLVNLGFSYANTSMSNIGLMRPEEYALDGHAPVDAFMTGAAKWKPYIHLSMTTYQGAATFMFVERGNQKDYELLTALMDRIYQNFLEI